MPNEDAESPEVRDAINATLRDVLCNDGWGRSHWNVVIEKLRKEFDIETDLMALAQSAPCLVQMFQIGALARKGIIGRDTQETLRQIIRNLVRIAYRAETGDEQASDQLKVIHKLTHPKNYDLPATVIKNLADSYYLSPHLERAWAVRSLMFDLSYVVEPTHEDRSVLHSPVKLAARPVGLYEPTYEKAARHIKKNSTLQSLAIDLYMDELDKEGIHLDPRQLRLDLKKLKEWEAINLTDSSRLWPLWDGDHFPPAGLPGIPIYVESWKSRWRRGNKK
jgi:hypothetical protein